MVNFKNILDLIVLKKTTTKNNKKKEWRRKLVETTETVIQISQPKMEIKIIERLGSRLQTLP
jgi:hypothetical protein